MAALGLHLAPTHPRVPALEMQLWDVGAPELHLRSALDQLWGHMAKSCASVEGTKPRALLNLTMAPHLHLASVKGSWNLLTSAHSVTWLKPTEMWQGGVDFLIRHGGRFFIGVEPLGPASKKPNR